MERKLKPRYESRLCHVSGEGELLLVHDTEEEQDVWYEMTSVPDEWFEDAG
ncbi:MAG TPA: hypothetical protein VFH53_06020 [Phycisphaerae bacterium]|nr:hypothetical protein [Phycisphaerae bacterium]HUX02247.1 hypothetical protein [Phycisphaerae bacterium]